MVRDRADAFGDRLAYTYLEDGETPGATLTFGELEREARRFAHGLRAHTKPGDRVLLVFAPGADFLVAFHACLFAGVVAVPTFPPEPRRLEKSLARLRSIVRDAEPTLAVGHTFFGETIRPTLGGVRWHDWSDLGDATLAEPHPARAADLAFLQYTSGSTGEPRGVMVTHANLVANSAYIAHVSGNDDQRVAVCWLPSYHDMGLIEGLLQPIFGGYRCYAMSPLAFLEQPRRWLQAMSRYAGTNTGGPSFAYELCCKRISQDVIATLDLSAWRVGYNGAEPIRLETLERFYEIFGPRGLRKSALYPVYGLAEFTLMASSSVPGDEPVALAVDKDALTEGRIEERSDGKRLPSAGRVVAPFATAIIVDPTTGQQLAPDRVGEIWMQGDSVAAGYFRRDDTTRETFHATTSDGRGPFLRTGDLGFLQGDRLFVVGRKKDLIIIRGENHHPHDIEWTVEAAHPSIRAGCVAAISLERDGQETLAIAAELKSRTKDHDVEAAIRKAVSAKHGLDIAELRLLDPGALPKTSSGKLQRSTARTLFAASPATPAAPAPPAEPVLSKPWQRAAHAFVIQRLTELRRAAPLASDPPSSLGLSSIEITSLKGELEEAFERRFDIGVLIDAATLSAGIEEMLTLADKKSAPRAAAPHTQRASLNEAAAFAWQELHPRSDALLVTVEITLTEPLDAARLDDAVARLVARHEALRSRFALVSGTPQRIPADATDYAPPIEIGDGPPFSIMLPTPRTLRLAFHHAGLDLDAVGVFVAELDLLYRNPMAELPAVAQAGEWAALQAAAPPDRERWQRAFERPAEPIVFPFGAASSPAHRTLPASLLAQRARELEVTPFAVLFSALAAALAQHGNRGGFWLGVSASARSARFRSSIASFTHVVPVYVPPRAHEMTFAELTRTLARSLQSSIDRDALPTRPITELVTPSLRHDVLRAVVHYRHLPAALDSTWAQALLTQSASAVSYFGRPATARAWLGRDTQAPFELDISAAADRDLDVTARGSTGGNAVLLAAAADLVTQDPGRTVIDSLAAPARASPEAPSSTDLFFAIEQHARDGRRAIIYPDVSYDYAALLDHAQRFAGVLRDRNVKKGDVVAFYCEPMPETAMALLGAWLAGATALMLDTSLPALRIAEALTTTAPVLCVYCVKQESHFPQTELSRIDLLRDATWRAEPAPATPMDPASAAVQWFAPRASTEVHGISYRDLFTAAARTTSTRDDCFALGTLTSTPSWAMDLAGTLFVGARVYIAPVLDLGCPGWQAAHMREEGVTAIRVSQFRLRLFLNDMVAPARALPTIERWIIDGGPLSQNTLAKIPRFLGDDRVRVAWSPPTIGHEVTAGERSVVGSVGRPLADVAIVDASGAPLPFDTEGHVVACGRRTDRRGMLTSARELVLSPLPTDGDLLWIRGELVSVPRVEAELQRMPGVTGAKLLPFIDVRGEVQLAAYVTGDVNLPALRSALLPRLATEEIPFSIERVASLENLARPRWARIGEAPAPRSAAERAVAEIFERVLDVKVRTVNDDFFLLGGDSMLAVKLVDELWRRGLRLSLAEVKDVSTVGALAKRLAGVAG